MRGNKPNQFVPYIVDLGIVDSTQNWRGNLAYLAPELKQGGSLSHKSDIYSLGIMLLEALEGYEQISKRVRSGKSQDHQWRYRTILNRATAPEPSFRFDSARELITALKDANKQVSGGSVAGNNWMRIAVLAIFVPIIAAIIEGPLANPLEQFLFGFKLRY